MTVKEPRLSRAHKRRTGTGERSEGEEGRGEEEHMTTTEAGKSVGIHARQADIRNPTVGSSSLDAECRILSLFL